MNTTLYKSRNIDNRDEDMMTLEDLPRFEKRRRPQRNTFNTPIRRAVVRSYRRGGASSPPITSGFHRRIVKKVLHGIS